MVRLFSNTDSARVWAVACTLACSYCSYSTGSASPALWSTASCQLTAAIQWQVPQLASHPSLLPSSALPGLQDENQKVKTITALTISALAEASGALRMRCCRLRLGCWVCSLVAAVWFVPWFPTPARRCHYSCLLGGSAIVPHRCAAPIGLSTVSGAAPPLLCCMPQAVPLSELPSPAPAVWVPLCSPVRHRVL